MAHLADNKAIMVLQRQLTAERHERLRAQQQAGGLRSQNLRLRALLLACRTENARLRAGNLPFADALRQPVGGLEA